MLAAGAQPIRVPVGGDAADQVVSVNSLDDFACFHARLQPANGQHVLIMGAGLIGCEFANDLAQAGYRVSVVDPGARTLAALLPEAASAALQEALQAEPGLWQWRDEAGLQRGFVLAGGQTAQRMVQSRQVVL